MTPILEVAMTDGKINTDGDLRSVLVVECEVYSRVVGYFRPVSGWNVGKKQEFQDRRPVRLEHADKEDHG